MHEFSVAELNPRSTNVVVLNVVSAEICEEYTNVRDDSPGAVAENGAVMVGGLPETDFVIAVKDVGRAKFFEEIESVSQVVGNGYDLVVSTVSAGSEGCLIGEVAKVKDAVRFPRVTEAEDGFKSLGIGKEAMTAATGEEAFEAFIQVSHNRW
jgi:hypothetical protein